MDALMRMRTLCLWNCMHGYYSTLIPSSYP